MFFRKSEHRTYPYVALTIGTLAMIGAFTVVRCTKHAAGCMRNKMASMFRDKSTDDCTVCD